MKDPGMDIIAEEAARWVAKLDREDWRGEQEMQLQSWLALDRRHAGALLQAQAAWIAIDVPAATTADAPEAQLLSRRRAILAGAGATLAASIVAGLLQKGAATHYSTVLGEIRRVPLDDGSLAMINTDSQIDVVYTRERRKVQLHSGEAWFKVAKDPSRPFRVDAGNVQVQAIGTAFSVRRIGGSVEVVVTEGVVDAWIDGQESQLTRLMSGTRFLISGAAKTLAFTRTSGGSGPDRRPAWCDGRIELVGERLDKAIEEFNRYNRRKLILIGPALAVEQFDGLFRIDDPEGFALAVGAGLGVEIDLSSPEAIRISSPSE